MYFDQCLVQTVLTVQQCEVHDITDIGNGVIQQSNITTGSLVPINTTLTVTCNNNTQLLINDTIICMESGLWNSSLPRCLGEYTDAL